MLDQRSDDILTSRTAKHSHALRGANRSREITRRESVRRQEINRQALRELHGYFQELQN